MNPKVDWFFDKESNWQEAYQELRDIVLGCKLTEELKWGCPCYTYHENNIVLIHGFKKYCALLFMKGSVLKDTAKILVQQTENVQVTRQIRFAGLDEIFEQRAVIQAYINEAIELERLYIKVEMKPTTDYKMPEEFQNALHEMNELSTAFYQLTPGRQRGYLLYFSSAKQAKTRTQRIEKYILKILDGKGLED